MTNIRQIGCVPPCYVVTEGYEGDLAEHPAMLFSASLEAPVFELTEDEPSPSDSRLIFTPPPEGE